MKTFIVLIPFLVSLIATISANQHPFFTDERLPEVIQISKECIEKTNIQQEVLTKWRNGDLIDDPTLKQYIGCTFLKLGYIHEDGKVDIANLKKDLKQSDVALSAIYPCYNKHGNSLAETAYDVYKCFKTNLPIQYKGGL